MFMCVAQVRVTLQLKKKRVTEADHLFSAAKQRELDYEATPTIQIGSEVMTMWNKLLRTFTELRDEDRVDIVRERMERFQATYNRASTLAPTATTNTSTSANTSTRRPQAMQPVPNQPIAPDIQMHSSSHASGNRERTRTSSSEGYTEGEFVSVDLDGSSSGTSMHPLNNSGSNSRLASPTSAFGYPVTAATSSRSASFDHSVISNNNNNSNGSNSARSPSAPAPLVSAASLSTGAVVPAAPTSAPEVVTADPERSIVSEEASASDSKEDMPLSTQPVPVAEPVPAPVPELAPAPEQAGDALFDNGGSNVQKAEETVASVQNSLAAPEVPATPESSEARAQPSPHHDDAFGGERPEDDEPGVDVKEIASTMNVDTENETNADVEVSSKPTEVAADCGSAIDFSVFDSVAPSLLASSVSSSSSLSMPATPAPTPALAPTSSSVEAPSFDMSSLLDFGSFEQSKSSDEAPAPAETDSLLVFGDEGQCHIDGATATPQGAADSAAMNTTAYILSKEYVDPSTEFSATELNLLSQFAALGTPEPATAAALASTALGGGIDAAPALAQFEDLLMDSVGLGTDVPVPSPTKASNDNSTSEQQQSGSNTTTGRIMSAIADDIDDLLASV
jgi:hypothetical protein